MLGEFIGDELASRAKRVCLSILVPGQQALLAHDDGNPSAGDLLVGGVIGQAPGGVDLAVGTADCSFVAKTHARRDLLVAQALSQESSYRLFARLEELHGRLGILLPDLLYARLDVWVDEAEPRDRIPEERHDHLGQQVIRLVDIGVVAEDSGAAKG